MSCELDAVQGNVLRLVLVLLVDCDARVTRAFRDAGSRVRVLVRSCGLAETPGAIHAWHPLVLVTMRGVDLGGSVFEALTRVADAALVISDGDASADEVEVALVSAVFEGWNTRQARERARSTHASSDRHAAFPHG